MLHLNCTQKIIISFSTEEVYFCHTKEGRVVVFETGIHTYIKCNYLIFVWVIPPKSVSFQL